jgi:predicted lactoylglutathione lyase
MSLNYLCLVNGAVEYGSTSLSDFAHYQLVYAEEHQDADVQYLTLTGEEYDELFPYDEDEE